MQTKETLGNLGVSNQCILCVSLHMSMYLRATDLHTWRLLYLLCNSGRVRSFIQVLQWRSLQWEIESCLYSLLNPCATLQQTKAACPLCLDTGRHKVTRYRSPGCCLGGTL